jgi:transcriptional regulator with XRE-family HTH domain
VEGGRAVTDEVTKRRAKLGIELRKARTAAKMTQAQAAAKLGCRQGKINKIETTQCAVSSGDLSTLLAIYNLPERDKIAIQMLAARGVPTSSRSRVYLQMRALEPEATEILSLHSERLPGLLQSEHYARTQLARAGDAEDVASLLLDRQERIRLLTVENQPRYRVILSESSLHRMPGGRTARLVADQAQHLLDLCVAHEHISVQILTYNADIPFLDPDFTVLKYAGAQSDVAYVEYGTEGRLLRRAKTVAERERYWNQLHRAALTYEASRSFLHDVVAAARRAGGNT